MTSEGRVDFSRVLDEAFKFSAWEYAPENERQLENLRARVEEAREPAVLDAFNQVCAEGLEARGLALELRGRLDREGDTEGVREWLALMRAALAPRINTHLDIALRKWRDRKSSQQRRFAPEAQGFASGIQPVALTPEGLHPNSLRRLSPSQHWRILVDETGSCFDEAANGLRQDDRTLGRLVALLVPAEVQLPALPRFHATDATLAEVDAVVSSLLERPVGVFGFTVQDPAAQADRWISHVVLLVRWVVAQLPLEIGQRTRVEVLIEQRNHCTGNQLALLADTLESDFRRLAPERYGNLRLRLRFMGKDEPGNGYVDAIAFTWGSPAAASRDRLKKSGWLGHCLLRPSDRAVERLYLALQAGRDLPPADWYELCAATAHEPRGGLLGDALAKLGEGVKEDPALWNSYLDEVRQRMRAKRFLLDEVGRALHWLEQWGHQAGSLPPLELLILETARLAYENHRGQVDQVRILRCIDLARALREEAAADACEAILRIAVATTNVFEFGLMRDSIAEWLSEPVAVPGLLNHAKLRSTLGQIEAFEGNHAQARTQFEQAEAAFARLSNPVQAAREIAQTRAYRLIVSLDGREGSTEELQADLLQHFNALLKKTKPAEISRSLAYSGQERRYVHHLWLRALVCLPDAFAGARDAYLEQEHQWQTGQDHPWPLIEAYRGWLLHDAGQPALASRRFSMTIRQCMADGNGAVLLWMGRVLKVVADSLGVDVDGIALEEPERLAELLPVAPHAALARFVEEVGRKPQSVPQILALLDTCLPFNFH